MVTVVYYFARDDRDARDADIHLLRAARRMCAQYRNHNPCNVNTLNLSQLL